MDPNTLNQARFIQRTIKRLHSRMLKQHGPFLVEGDGDPTELTTTQLTTLTAVVDHKVMTLKEIAEATRVSAPSASTMVDKLVEAGALRREHSKVDRREVQVSISPKGRKAVDEFEKYMLEYVTELIDGVGPECAKMWCDVYEHIEQFIDESEKSRSENETFATQNPALGAR